MYSWPLTELPAGCVIAITQFKTAKSAKAFLDAVRGGPGCLNNSSRLLILSLQSIHTVSIGPHSLSPVVHAVDSKLPADGFSRWSPPDGVEKQQKHPSIAP